jgi:hypothetical protein
MIINYKAIPICLRFSFALLLFNVIAPKTKSLGLLLHFTLCVVHESCSENESMLCNSICKLSGEVLLHNLAQLENTRG